MEGRTPTAQLLQGCLSPAVGWNLLANQLFLCWRAPESNTCNKLIGYEAGLLCFAGAAPCWMNRVVLTSPQGKPSGFLEPDCDVCAGWVSLVPLDCVKKITLIHAVGTATG